MKSRNSLRKEQDETRRANLVGVPIQTLGGDKIKIRDNVYDSTEQIHNAVSS